MTGLFLYNFRSNFLDLENDVIWVFCVNAWEERRRKERRMSRCFTKLHIGEMGIPTSVTSGNRCGVFIMGKVEPLNKYLLLPYVKSSSDLP